MKSKRNQNQQLNNFFSDNQKRMLSFKSFIRSRPVQVISRGYATKPEITAADIDALIARVSVVTTKAAEAFKARKGGFQQRRPHNFNQKNNRAQAEAQNINTASKPRLVNSRMRNNKNKASSEIGDAFTDISSKFSQAQIRRTNNINNKNNNNNNNNSNQRRSPFRRAQPQSSVLTSQLKGKFNNKPRSRPQQQRKSSSNESIPLHNPNFDAIQTQYIPNIPTFSELLSESQITSQTASSRILKAYQVLQHDKNADVSGILSGKFSEAGNGILEQMKTPALKLNADVVVNCLNKNSTIDYETKLRLLKPLTGLAPVKQLSS